eukprot:CAMPEP_0194056916 /NCGR_PEP_ID=MMETSP0009_2-20130614/61731_1 /TAXON_ID=210454 /ORGANISM="Grammatophora oceanica, Strain CCMP 410" /LENGTH=67 /DNA_ID=CAMNT_0038706481 /DNA_START=19 /DNA_END=219 /DNA_ORIENTATION=+
MKVVVSVNNATLPCANHDRQSADLSTKLWAQLGALLLTGLFCRSCRGVWFRLMENQSSDERQGSRQS